MFKLKINNEVSLGEIDHDDETVAEQYIRPILIILMTFP